MKRILVLNYLEGSQREVGEIAIKYQNTIELVKPNNLVAGNQYKGPFTTFPFILLTYIETKAFLVLTGGYNL